MSTTLLSVVAGTLFGLALAAPPGPMNDVIAGESVAHGWSAGRELVSVLRRPMSSFFSSR